MKNSKKVIFVIFNICYFLFDWIIVTIIPNPIIFGWLPLQLFILLFLPIPAALIWGIYFNAFFNTQSHVNYGKNKINKGDIL